MQDGLAAGLLWALDTVILSIAMAPFGLNPAVPAAATFWHDTFSALLLTGAAAWRHHLRALVKILKTRQGRWLVLAGFLGGPIGMGGYVFAIRYAGAGVAALFSGLYPMIGLIAGKLVFHETISKRQIQGLALCLSGVALLSSGSFSRMREPVLGLVFGGLCLLGWGLEGVIVQLAEQGAKKIGSSEALTIRQVTSSLSFGLILLPMLKGWPVAAALSVSSSILWIALAALVGTQSYLCYYRAIQTIGAARAQPLNITYTAWALLFSFLFSGQIPSLTEILAALMIAGGAALCAGAW